MIGVFWTTGEYVRELRLALVCHMVTSTTRTVQLLGHRNLRATQAEAAASSDWNKKRTHLKGTGTLPIPIDPPPSLISYTTQSATNAMQQIVNLISAQQLLLPTNQHKLSSCSSSILG